MLVKSFDMIGQISAAIAATEDQKKIYFEKIEQLVMFCAATL
jgi:hypothetical protein